MLESQYTQYFHNLTLGSFAEANCEKGGKKEIFVRKLADNLKKLAFSYPRERCLSVIFQ